MEDAVSSEDLRFISGRQGGRFVASGPCCKSGVEHRTTLNIMSDHFPDVSKIEFEGPGSDNPLAFRHYNPDELVAGKSMKDHLRFGAAYWHCMRNPLGDPFGAGTAHMPWDDGSESLDNGREGAL